MIDSKVLLAAGIVLLLFSALVGAFVLDAVGQVRGTFHYIPPGVLVELCEKCLDAALFTLGLGGLSHIRKITAELEEKKLEAKKTEEQSNEKP